MCTLTDALILCIQCVTIATATGRTITGTETSMSIFTGFNRLTADGN